MRFPLPRQKISKAAERGYALLALIAAMTVMGILAAGYVPHLVRQMQREREEEMLFRGLQIVNAIAQYVQMTGRYPSSLEELVRGFSVQTPRGLRRVRFLRPSALVDPMTNGEWKVVRPGDPVLRRFVEAYLESIQQPANPMLLQFLQPGMTIALPGRSPALPARPQRFRGPTPRGVTSSSPAEVVSQTPFPSEEGAGPILGVVSRSERKTVRVYYGLDRYSDWPFVFIPVLPAAVGEARLRAALNPAMFPSDPLARLLEARIPGPRRVVPQRPAVQPGIRR